MKFLVSVHRVSEFFFLLLGTLYLLAFLFWKNDFHAFYAGVFLRLGDIPLAFFGSLFAMTSLRISFSHQHLSAEEGGEEKKGFPFLDLFLVLIALGIFGGVAFVDLFFENQFPFPKVL